MRTLADDPATCVATPRLLPGGTAVTGVAVTMGVATGVAMGVVTGVATGVALDVAVGVATTGVATGWPASSGVLSCELVGP